MVGRRKNTARKSVGGAAKRIQLIPVSDRVLRTASRSPSAAPPPIPDSDADQPPAVEKEVEIDAMEVDNEGGVRADDVRFLFLRGSPYLSLLVVCTVFRWPPHPGHM